MKAILSIVLYSSSLGILALDYSRPAHRDYHPLARRRLGLEHNSSANNLTSLSDCPGEICGTLAGQAIAPLLAAAPICAQQEMAEKIIDAAKDMSNKIGSQDTRDKMIKIAQEYRKAEKNTHPIYYPGNVGRNSVYCQKDTKHPELKGLFQAQDPSNHPLLFFDPLVKTNGSTVVLGSQPNTFPFGTHGGTAPNGTQTESLNTLNSTDSTLGGNNGSLQSTGTNLGGSQTLNTTEATLGGNNGSLQSTGTDLGGFQALNATSNTTTKNDNTLDSTESDLSEDNCEESTEEELNTTSNSTDANNLTSLSTTENNSNSTGQNTLNSLDNGNNVLNSSDTGNNGLSSLDNGNNGLNSLDTGSNGLGSLDNGHNGLNSSDTGRNGLNSLDTGANNATSLDTGNNNLTSGSTSSNTLNQNSSASGHTGSNDTDLVLDVNTLPNKECRDMRIEFGKGFPTRDPQDLAYEPFNFAVHKHGPALNIQIIMQFMCDDLRNTCGLTDVGAYQNCTALSNKIGSAKGSGAKADQWNLGFGFVTHYATGMANGPGSGQSTGGVGSLPSNNTSTLDSTLTSNSQLTTTPSANNTDSTPSGGGSTGGAVIDVSKIPNEKCRDMRIEFGSGFPGREAGDMAYQPFNRKVHNHGGALGLQIIMEFMCDELLNTCGLHQGDNMFNDCKALIQAVGPAKGKGAAADKWNAGFGFITTYATEPATGEGTGGKGDGITHPDASTLINTSSTPSNGTLNSLNTNTNSSDNNNMNTNSMNNNNMNMNSMDNNNMNMNSMNNNNMNMNSMNNNNMNMNSSTNPSNNNITSVGGNNVTSVNGTGSGQL